MTREEWRDRAIEHGAEIIKLKKQLAIAVEALEWIMKSTKTGHIQCDACCYEISCEGCSNQDKAEQALQQIEELNK